MPGNGWQNRLSRSAVALVVCLALPAAAAPPRKRSVKTERPAAPQTSNMAAGHITDVRFWSLADATRIAVETDSEFEYHSDRVPNPDRLFFDIAGVKPTKVPKGVETIRVGDPLVRQIRVAETVPGTTRVVLDLNAGVEFTASQLSNPSRLMIEVRPQGRTTPAAEPNPITTRTFEPPPDRTPAPPAATAKLAVPKLKVPAPAQNPAVEHAVASASVQPTAAPPPVAAPAQSGAKVESPATPATSSPAIAAKRNSSGERSLTRVLGLKLGRVVLDPGHGGHDAGTRGPSGLLEKDLVLDVSRRLGALIEDRLGSEVIYTRDDDTFVPLEERTRIANRHKADLFLSIHANSSTVRSASGVETYYLNFTTNKSALEVAARENASSERSIYDLRELVQKIALKDKLDESREFAARVQASLTSATSRSSSRSKDRGVRKAPFVVLIGASMPSILAEIGFVSNPQDENLMKKPEYRQKLAEALYKGVSQYAASLSRFQVAGGRRTNSSE